MKINSAELFTTKALPWEMKYGGKYLSNFFQSKNKTNTKLLSIAN